MRESILQSFFKFSEERFIYSGKSDYWSDQRNYAFVDILFLDETNALFTHIFGVFRGFLFSSNRKIRESLAGSDSNAVWRSSRHS